MAERTMFASTWRGRAWIEALEGSARLDPNRLSRGRSYARQGAVGALMIEPGMIRARVSGSHGRYYRVEIAVKTIATDAWERVVDAIAAKAAHAAALADGDLDPVIVDDVAAAGVDLLPGPGDIRPHCSCPDWAEPCKHAAAVCYLVAAELDRDPFLLFALRGLGRDDLNEMLAARRRGSRGTDSDGPTLGVVASTAWEGRQLDEPLDPFHVDVSAPARPGRPLSWDALLPADERVDPRRVDELAVDATIRAWSMLVDGSPSGLRATPRGDIARLAAASQHPKALATLSARVRLSAPTLQAWAEAWNLGGDPGVEVIADEDSWSIDQDRLSAGRDALVELGIPKRSVALNYDSLGMPKGVKLVIGFDGLWYRLQAKGGARGTRDQLHLAAPPSTDIADVVEP